MEEITVEGIDVPIARKRFLVAHLRGKRAAPIIRRTKNEVATLLRLSHPHIVSLIGCYQEEEAANRLNMYAHMHPVGDGDIKTLLEACGTLATLDPCEIQSADDLFVRSLWMQVPKWLGYLASALAYMHSQGVHHEDIKPAVSSTWFGTLENHVVIVLRKLRSISPTANVVGAKPCSY